MGGFAEELDIGLFDLLPDVLLLVRREKVVWANQAASRLLGGSPIGRSLEEILATGERERLALIERQRQTNASELPVTCRVHFVRASDHAKVTTDLRFVKRDGDLVMSARDVTDLIRAEKLMGRLAQTFARASAFIDADELLDASEPIFEALGWKVAFTEIVPDGSITRRMMGAPDGDPVGDYGRSIIGVKMPPDKTPILTEIVRTCRPLFLDNLPTLLSGPLSAATALAESMGRANVYRSSWCPIVKNGRVAFVVAVTGRDLTEHDFVAVQLFAAQIGAAIQMQSLRSELVHKERLAAVGEMAAVLAHEVRNPLAIIFNVLSELRKRTQMAPTSELLDILQQEAERLRRLVTDLLDFSRPSSVEMQHVGIVSILQQAVEAARLDPTVGGNPREIVLDIPANLPSIETDPLLLRRALINLLTNALQHVSDEGQVSLTVRLERDELYVGVHNDGPPLAPEIASRIFEPFFTTRASGTGLGLAVVRRIVEDLGGRVELENEETRGTTFALRFGPRCAA